VHGDDIVLVSNHSAIIISSITLYHHKDAEGNDCYGAFRQTGMYKECKRTDGISTTSLIQRILCPDEWELTDTDHARLENLMDLFVAAVPYAYPVIQYDTLSSELDLMVIRRGWAAQKKVVYIGGGWDCFGAGHVELLRRSKSVADDVLLVVGIWSDQV
jgi:ethanolamine-phosphate cytidylyltransferase